MAVVHPAEKVGELVVVWSNHRGAVSILDHEDVNRENEWNKVHLPCRHLQFPSSLAPGWPRTQALRRSCSSESKVDAKDGRR